MFSPGVEKDGTCYAWWSPGAQAELVAAGGKQPVVALPLDGETLLVRATTVTKAEQPPDATHEWVCLGRGKLTAVIAAKE